MIGPSAVLVAFRKAASSRRSPKSPSRRSTYGASVAAREAGARPVAHGVSRGRQAAAYAQPQRGERGAASFARSTGFRSPVPLTHGSRRGLRSYVPAGPVSAATDQPVRQSERTESGGGMTSGLCCSCRGHPALECRGHLSCDEVVFEAGTASRREGKMPSPHSAPATPASRRNLSDCGWVARQSAAMSISSRGRHVGQPCKRACRNEIQRRRATSGICHRKSSFCVSCFGPLSESIVVEGSVVPDRG